MTKEEAVQFLTDISWEIGTTAMDHLTDKDGEKIRDAVRVLSVNEKEDPTVREVWNSLPDDIREIVYSVTTELAKNQGKVKNVFDTGNKLKSIRIDALTKNQQKVIFYLFGEAVLRRSHVMDSGKDTLFVEDQE